MISLQSQPGTVQNIDQLTKASIELAEAAANYGALKIIFGVFMAVMLLIVLVFISQSVFLTKKVQILSETSEKVSKYFEGLSNRDIGKDEANSMFREVLNHNSVLIKYYILRVRTENNIANKKSTETKVRRMIRNIYSESTNYLNKFLLEGKPLHLIIESDSDSDSIFALMWEQIYIPLDEFNLSQMDQSVELFMQELKLNYITKLESL